MNLIIPDPMGIYIFSVCPRLQLLRQTEETGDMGRIRGKRGESGTADRRLETGDRRRVAKWLNVRHRHGYRQRDTDTRRLKVIQMLGPNSEALFTLSSMQHITHKMHGHFRRIHIESRTQGYPILFNIDYFIY